MGQNLGAIPFFEDSNGISLALYASSGVNNRCSNCPLKFSYFKMTHTAPAGGACTSGFNSGDCLPEEYCDIFPTTPVCKKCPGKCAKCSNATTCTLCSRFSTGWKNPDIATNCKCKY